jgi:hypothetical protein
MNAQNTNGRCFDVTAVAIVSLAFTLFDAAMFMSFVNVFRSDSDWTSEMEGGLLLLLSIVGAYVLYFVVMWVAILARRRWGCWLYLLFLLWMVPLDIWEFLNPEEEGILGAMSAQMCFPLTLVCAASHVGYSSNHRPLRISGSRSAKA